MHPMSGEDDGALLTAWGQGDKAAGGILIDRYFSPVCRFFANKLPDDVEDLVQKTFLACVEGRDRIRERASFRSYLFAVAHNILRRHLRERTKIQDTQDDRGTDALDRCVLAEVTPSPSTIVADRKEQRLLLLGLRRLTLPQQVALELYFWERMSAAQIGEVLGSPEGTIRTRIRDGRLRLAEHIDALRNDPGGIPTTASDVDGWAERIAAMLEQWKPPDDADP